MVLTQDVKDQIEGGYLKKPCIKCGSIDHPAINHTGAGFQGPVWKTILGSDLMQANNFLAKLRTDYVKNQKKSKKAGGPSAQQSLTTVVEPVIAPANFDTATATNANRTDPYTTMATSLFLNIKDQAHGEPVDTTFRQANPGPGSTEFGSGHEHKPDPAKLQVVGAKFPLRKQFAEPTGEVFTNYFEVSWKPNTKFFVYEITNIPDGNKRKTKSVVKTAIQAWDFLKDNEDSFATDYLKTIIAWKDLHSSIQCLRTNGIPGEVEWTPSPVADGDRRIELGFKFHGEMNLDRLQDYVNPKSKPNDAALPDFNFSPLVAYLNTVVAKSLTDEVFSTSSHKFFFKDSHQALGSSRALCVMRGYDYTIQPAMEKVLLNVNAATSAFHCPITVAEFMRDNTFHENEREKRVKRLRVYIVPDRRSVADPGEQKKVDNLNMTQNRIKTIKNLGKNIGNRSEPRLSFHKWEMVGGQLQQAANPTHVVEHMKAVFGTNETFSEGLPAVNVGTDDDPVWYPQEYLRILPYQLYKNVLPDTLIDSMLKLACKTPDSVRASIESEGLRGLGVIQNDGLKSFAKCDALYVRPEMLKIPSTRMKPVTVAYRGLLKAPQMDAKAQWNLDGDIKFIETLNSTQNLRYYVLKGHDLQDQSIVGTYKTTINQMVKQYSIGTGATCIAEATLPNYRKIIEEPDNRGNMKERWFSKTHEELKDDIEKAIDECKNQAAEAILVILILERHSIPVYSAFKDAADRVSAMQNLCVTAEKNRGKPVGDRNLLQYFANVMMKVNLKCGGRNHTVCDNDNNLVKDQGRLSDILNPGVPKRSTMILGADVTHPGGGSLIGCPSVAALVGSIDSEAGKFLGSMRIQNKSKKEMIDGIGEMARERFQAWRNVHGNAPNVLYYRDGVSTGQYEQVLREELSAITIAWKTVFQGDFTSDLKMTALVAVKRHHTRFFPMPADATTNGNCKAGTLVDTAITSPFFSEFYLQSHHALQGTAIPTKYFVLLNDLGLSDTVVQRLTHKLCFTYVRATMGVSYAPPAYYADRLCERGRSYLRDWFTPNYDSDHYRKYQAKKDEIELRHKKTLRDAVAALPPVPVPAGRRRAPKSQAQIDLERKSGADMEADVEDKIRQQAQEYFEKERMGGPGPWAAALDKTMFWM